MTDPVYHLLSHYKREGFAQAKTDDGMSIRVAGHDYRGVCVTGWVAGVDGSTRQRSLTHATDPTIALTIRCVIDDLQRFMEFKTLEALSK